MRCKHHRREHLQIHNEIGMLLRHLRITDSIAFETRLFDKVPGGIRLWIFKAHPAFGMLNGWVSFR